MSFSSLSFLLHVCFVNSSRQRTMPPPLWPCSGFPVILLFSLFFKCNASQNHYEHLTFKAGLNLNNADFCSATRDLWLGCTKFKPIISQRGIRMHLFHSHLCKNTFTHVELRIFSPLLRTHLFMLLVRAEILKSYSASGSLLTQIVQLHGSYRP